jgi:hypothetical protein
VRQPDTLKYDVIVDEAPAGPNQKERTFMFLTAFAPMLKEVVPPQMWLDLLEYTPLPASLVAKMQQTAKNMPKQEDPKANAKQAPLTLPVKGIAGGQVLALKPESVCLMI